MRYMFLLGPSRCHFIKNVGRPTLCEGPVVTWGLRKNTTVRNENTEGVKTPNRKWGQY